MGLFITLGCQVAALLLVLAPSMAGAQSRVEQGREVLNGVRATHLMIDFGINVLQPDQVDSYNLAQDLATKTNEAESRAGDDEWHLRLAMLHVETFGRDMVAGKPISASDAKILDEYFKHPLDPVTGWRADEETARTSNEIIRTQHQGFAARLSAGRPLADDDCIMGWESFRSGDQLTWRIAGLSFDVAAILKAYPSASPKSKHEMRMLLGLCGRADETCVAFLQGALRGSTPIERYDAAIAAGQMRPASDKLILALTERLSDLDPRVARAACRSLLALNAGQSAPAMLHRLGAIIEDKASALVAQKLRFQFDEYHILDSFIGFRYDLPTEIIFALGCFRCRATAPLLWEIVGGKGRDIWRHEGIYELDHGGVAAEAILAMDAEHAAAAARRVLAFGSATVDAKGAAANLLGECGGLADVPVLLKLMASMDAAARRLSDHHYTMHRAMSRVSFAAERLLFFADTSDRSFAGIRHDLVVALRRCANGPFGPPFIAALEDFDPQHVEATALGLAADPRAEPDARRIATEILTKSNKLCYVEPLLALFEDDGNATNGPVGLHAARAASKILAAADRADPQVAICAGRVADKLERMDVGKSRLVGGSEFRAVLVQVDSNRGVRVCSCVALDEHESHSRRSMALEQIAQYAKPNRELAMRLRPLLDISLGKSVVNADLRDNALRERATNECRATAARAIATLLGLKYEAKRATSSAIGPAQPVYDPAFTEMVRKETDRTVPGQ